MKGYYTKLLVLSKVKNTIYESSSNNYIISYSSKTKKYDTVSENNLNDIVSSCEATGNYMEIDLKFQKNMFVGWQKKELGNNLILYKNKENQEVVIINKNFETDLLLIIDKNNIEGFISNVDLSVIKTFDDKILEDKKKIEKQIIFEKKVKENLLFEKSKNRNDKLKKRVDSTLNLLTLPIIWRSILILLLATPSFILFYYLYQTNKYYIWILLLGTPSVIISLVLIWQGIQNLFDGYIDKYRHVIITLIIMIPINLFSTHILLPSETSVLNYYKNILTLLVQ